MPKKPARPDPNQLMALMIAKAAGTPVPEHLKKYEHLVKRVSPKRSKKKRA